MDPNTQKESMQWKRLGLPPPKKFRTQPSAGKVMPRFFETFSHDYAPVHKSRVAQVTISECKCEQSNHPPQSSNQAPSDYYLFRKLKTHLFHMRFLDADRHNAATVLAWGPNRLLIFQRHELLKRDVGQMH